MDYVSHRRGEWEELEKLVRKARRLRGPGRMTGPEILRLDLLYRRVTVDLAQSTARTRDSALAHYLNGLAASAHAVLYSPPRERLLPRLATYFLDSFPMAVAAHWRAHLLATLIFFLGGAAAWEIESREPSAAYLISFDRNFSGNGGLSRTPGASPEALRAQLRQGRDSGASRKSLFSGFLFSNNFRVALLSMLTGVLGGVPTVLLGFYNGLMLGDFVHTYHGAGIYLEVWAWFLPHFFMEIGAIMLCNGAGLFIGRAVVAPGFRSRPEALRLAGRDAARILGGVCAMVAFAALTESFLRQSNLTSGLRLAFAAGTFLLLLGLFLRGLLLNREAARRAAWVAAARDNRDN